MIREYFNAEQLKKMEEGLAKAPPSTNRMSKADVLRQLAPMLNDLRVNKNYTLEALVELLAAQGLRVKVSTLQGALKKKSTGKKKATKAAVTIEPPVTAKQASEALSKPAVKKVA